MFDAYWWNQHGVTVTNPTFQETSRNGSTDKMRWYDASLGSTDPTSPEIPKYARMEVKGKLHGKIIAAVARELAGSIWAMATSVELKTNSTVCVKYNTPSCKFIVAG